MSVWQKMLNDLENETPSELTDDYQTYPFLKLSRHYPKIDFWADRTPMILEEIDYRIRNNSNFVMRMSGVQGSGKSVLSLAIGVLYCQKVNELIGHTPKFYYTFSLEETIEKWLEMDQWDIIMEDEAPALQGPNSYTIQKNYTNMLDQERAYHKSLIKNSPRFAYISGIAFAIETFGFSEKYQRTHNPLDMKTKGRVFYPQIQCSTTARIPLGMIEMCVGTPECTILHEDYVKAKMANIKKLEENQGSVGSDLKQRVTQLVSKINEKIESDYPTVKICKSTLKAIIVDLDIPVSSTIMDLAIQTILMHKNLKKKEEFDE